MKRRLTQPDADWTIAALLDARPGASRVLLRHGMACVGCAMAPFETLAEAAREYRRDLPALLRELREAEAGRAGRGRRREGRRDEAGP